MVIDARYEFGKKFIRDTAGKPMEEINERLRVMGSSFTRMVGYALDKVKETKENPAD